MKDALDQLHFVFPAQKFTLHGNNALDKKVISESCITNNYCFNGYAKLDKQLIAFKNQFEKEFTIPINYFTPSSTLSNKIK